MFWIVAALVVVLDQLTKALVRSHMTLDQTIPVFGRLAGFTYIQNTGAAFSILEGRKLFLILLTCAIMAALCAYYLLMRKKMLAAERVALGLIFGGGIGNLICRIRLGFVTDFINIHIIPVFNVADMGVTIGCVLLFLTILVLEPRARKRGTLPGAEG